MQHIIRHISWQTPICLENNEGTCHKTFLLWLHKMVVFIFVRKIYYNHYPWPNEWLFLSLKFIKAIMTQCEILPSLNFLLIIWYIKSIYQLLCVTYMLFLCAAILICCICVYIRNISELLEYFSTRERLNCSTTNSRDWRECCQA